jgi:DNA-binding SARP family transcriptional activator/class 3 adenylate cyclase
VQFRILGPLEVLADDGRPLVLGGAKQRALLAVLLVHAGQVVSADRLIDELWGENPPETARSVLQVYVANLRKILEPARRTRAASTLLVTQPPGYLLDLGRHAFDLAHFEQLLNNGRDGLAAGDPRVAAGALREALALWRGPVLGDVAAEVGAQGALARLEEQRLTTLEQRIEADLALGRHSELVGELEALVTTYKLRERLRGQLMVALYRCGRQAEALDAYRQARETLAEELGIDPSRPLRELERAVLTQDPTLDWTPTVELPQEPVAMVTSVPAKPGPAMATPADPSPRAREPVEERKVVTVLFCGPVGLAAGTDQVDPEDARARLRPYHARVRVEIQRFGGMAERSLGQGVTGVFGAPVAHEDDPERAVRAGLRILEAIEELNQAVPSLDLSLRIGISTGQALVALHPGPEAGEGLLAGDVVDAAAHLCGLAPVGGVVVDQATWRSTRRWVTYKALAPVEGEGRPEPVSMWRATAARSRHGAELRRPAATPFVGRKDELAVLQGVYRRAVREASVQVVTVTGEPGVGKSRLVRELFSFVDGQPDLVDWRQGRCLPYGDGVTYWALGEIVKAEAGILESDGPGEAADKLAAAVEAVEERPNEREWLQARLAPLVGLSGTEGAAQREEAFAAWRQFLEAVAARNALVVVIEDLHWADAALLEFLQHLMEWSTGVPMLVVCTARPELYERMAGWGGGTRNATTLALPPLTDEHITKLIAALLDQSVLPTKLQTLLLERAGGNPLYAEEFVRLLRDQGVLTRRGRAVRLREGAEVPVPDTVQALIAARLDTLSLERKALLQNAAVVGQVFWSGALASMGNLDERQVRSALHELARYELLRPVRHSSVKDQAEYAFWHVLVRDVAYNQLPRAARADRHRRAAEWLEALTPDRAEDRAELLAHHYQAALQFARAAGQDTTGLAAPARLALREAGNRALELHAFAAAARWYAAALELWPADDPERPRLLLRLGEARLYGEQAGGELLVEARDGLLAQGDREAAAEAEALLSMLAVWQVQGERAMQHARRAVALLKDAGPSPTKAYALARLAQDLSIRPETAQAVQEAIQVGRQALRMADRLGLHRDRVGALQAIGTARVLGGDLGGIADLEQAIEIAVEHNLPVSAMACGDLASILISLGQLARGFQLQAQARHAAERFGLRGVLRWLQAEGLLEDYWRGRWDAALEGADQFLAEAEADGSDFAEAGSRSVRGWIRLARGDLRGALQDADAGLEHARVAKELQVLYPSLAFRARALVVAGRQQEAGTEANKLLAMLAHQGVLPTAPDWSGDLAVVLQALGRGAELVELLADAKTPTGWFEAASALADGEFQRAADLYGHIEAQPDAAFARLQAATQLVGAGRWAEANEELRRALGFFRQVGATGYLGQADALAAASA